MKITHLIPALLIVVCFGCKKPHNDGGIGPLRLTSVKTVGVSFPITYNADGTIKSVGNHDLKYFNNGLLMEYITPSDTVALDGLGMLSYLKTNFNLSGRQTRYFFYDSQNRAIRTVTNTGNGLDYLQDLTYANGDVVNMVYNVGAGGSNPDHFTFSFYDTVCTDQYLGLYNWPQLGTTQNKHLLKTMIYKQDTTYYSYVLDSNNRVLISYRNWDNSGWTYARAIDTSYYFYTRQ